MSESVHESAMRRDPKRIKPFLDSFAALWEQFPDMRFGQLVVAVCGGLDPFYYEEDEMLANIWGFYARSEQSTNTVPESGPESASGGVR